MNELHIQTKRPQSETIVDPLSCISKITAKDKILLQETVMRLTPNTMRYEDSWGYVIQSTRYRGFKWYDPHTGSLIFFGRKSNSDNTLVIPVFFATPSYLAEVIIQIQNALKAPKTILKNINQNDISNFTPYGFRQYHKHEAWSKEARFDDQTYPQILLDLQSLAEKKGRRYHILRKALNKKPPVHLRQYKDSDREAVLKILDMKDGETKDTSAKRKGMYYTSHAIYPKADVSKYVIVENESSDIIGFTATSRVTNTTTALVASLFKPGIRVASIWGMYETLMLKYHEGFKMANMGGSETLKIYAFKHEKFPPLETLGKTHLVFNYPQAETA